MQVNIDEIGVSKIRGAEFFAGTNLLDRTTIYFAPLDLKKGPGQRWIVLDDNQRGNKDGYITVYTTEEMKLMCRSLKESNGSPVKAHKEMGYQFLVRSGKLRMKIKDGCPGCRRFWGGDCSEGQCVLCHRCYACCGRESIPYSCASGSLKKEAKRRYARRRK